MEAVAIVLLVMVLVLGGAVLTIFSQFLNIVRKNHAQNNKIMDELSVMAGQIDVLYKKSSLSKTDDVNTNSEEDDSSEEDE